MFVFTNGLYLYFNQISANLIRCFSDSEMQCRNARQSRLWKIIEWFFRKCQLFIVQLSKVQWKSFSMQKLHTTLLFHILIMFFEDKITLIYLQLASGYIRVVANKSVSNNIIEFNCAPMHITLHTSTEYLLDE
jgi:hypothetical protein